MNDKELQEFLEIIYPFIKKKLQSDGLFKNCVQAKNAKVVSVLADGETNIGKEVEVIFPYDTTSFFVRNECGKDLNKNDLVILEYWIDLKNAVVKYKCN